MQKIKNLFKKCDKYPIVFCVIVAFLLNLIIETAARQGITKGMAFLFSSPLVFFYNTLVIFAVLMFANLFKRKWFVFTILSMLWLVIGIVNGIILSNRMTPFTVYDIQSLKDGLSIATNYLSTFQLILIGVGIVALVVGIIFLWRKAPKMPDRSGLKKYAFAFVGSVVIAVGCTALFVKIEILDTYFPNLAYAYRDNGVPYCFINTWLNTGVSKPANYSEKNIKSIFTDEELKTTVGKTTGTQKTMKTPNIVFVQLESLMDPLTIKDVEFNEDPIPNLRNLYQTTSSGKLTVPSVGAGTANTEFESMTGMSVKFFGPGEYPYKNIMLESTCESIPYNLEQLGYSTHAIHNHRGVFYGRNSVFPNLGYDTFTSLEYMNNIAKTPKNWAKDNVLVDEIKKALTSTKERDYIYTISVQGHGKYPTEEVLKNPVIKCTKAPTIELKWQYEYYANQIHEMDIFVKNFIEEMKNFNEDTVVVMYGDHLPAIDNLTEENLTGNRSLYQTDYFIWSNFDMETIHEDLTSYQIGAELLKRLGITNGTLTTLHQNHQDDEDYLQELHDLQYDMLYGKKYIYDGKSPWQSTSMKMGIDKIKIDKIIQIGDKYYIKGENFTEYSKITLDGKILDTEFIGSSILLLKDEVDDADVSKMKISQVDKNEILSTSE